MQIAKLLFELKGITKIEEIMLTPPVKVSFFISLRPPMFPIAFFRSPNLSKPLQGGGGGARLLKMPVIACLTLITKNVTVVFETLGNAERGWGKGEEQ